ncbi:MAG: hypothetical protein ACPLRN_04125, partial [Microgenomates group bacterium]
AVRLELQEIFQVELLGMKQRPARQPNFIEGNRQSSDEHILNGSGFRVFRLDKCLSKGAGRKKAENESEGNYHKDKTGFSGGFVVFKV